MDRISRMIQSLEAFASEEIQTKAWVEGIPNLSIHFWIPELVCDWFDGAMRQKSPNELVMTKEITQEQRDIIAPFHERLRQFYDTHYNKNFEKSPRLLLEYDPWLELRELAHLTIEKLKAVK